MPLGIPDDELPMQQRDALMALMDPPFPTSEEAKAILEEAGIDMTDLNARCMALLCQKVGHKWRMTWPLDPCEYICTQCGVKTMH